MILSLQSYGASIGLRQDCEWRLHNGIRNISRVEYNHIIIVLVIISWHYNLVILVLSIDSFSENLKSFLDRKPLQMFGAGFENVTSVFKHLLQLDRVNFRGFGCLRLEFRFLRLAPDLKYRAVELTFMKTNFHITSFYSSQLVTTVV
jgi:hypothetical protein